ncbi:MAG: hypothetical protein NC311_06580 [Muribaculaceae bacterium]|nr:hypothetical protein [Muribaculaceae bacterium]
MNTVTERLLLTMVKSPVIRFLNRFFHWYSLVIGPQPIYCAVFVYVTPTPKNYWTGTDMLAKLNRRYKADLKEVRRLGLDPNQLVWTICEYSETA